jgi:hypothetical protein
VNFTNTWFITSIWVWLVNFSYEIGCCDANKSTNYNRPTRYLVKSEVPDFKSDSFIVRCLFRPVARWQTSAEQWWIVISVEESVRQYSIHCIRSPPGLESELWDEKTVRYSRSYVMTNISKINLTPSMPLCCRSLIHLLVSVKHNCYHVIITWKRLPPCLSGNYNIITVVSDGH